MITYQSNIDAHEYEYCFIQLEAEDEDGWCIQRMPEGYNWRGDPLVLPNPPKGEKLCKVCMSIFERNIQEALAYKREEVLSKVRNGN